MKCNFIFALLLMSFVWTAQGQQQLRRSQFVTNTYAANPAVAGTEPGTLLSSTFRHQWTGFGGAPSTVLFSAHKAVSNGLGIGAIFYSDDMGGAIQQTGFELTGAYSIQLNNEDAVSFGLSLKGNQFEFDGTNLQVWQPLDEALPGTLETSFDVDANVGMMVYGKDYYFGFAVHNLMQRELEFSSVEEGANRLVRHYNFMGSYLHKLNSQVSLQPSGLLRLTESTPVQLDMHCRAIVNGTFWGGLGFRPQDAVVISVGLRYTEFTVGYNYDITLASSLLSAHSHEFTLGFFVPKRSGFRSRPGSGRGMSFGERILK